MERCDRSDRLSAIEDDRLRSLDVPGLDIWSEKNICLAAAVGYVLVSFSLSAFRLIPSCQSRIVRALSWPPGPHGR